MELQAQEIRDQQRETWNKFSPGWQKWDELTMDFLKPMGNKIIQFLKLGGNDVVLDVASGTGEPGLSIASLLKEGKVVGIDLSEGMLETARQNAARRGIKNFETRVADVSELPFEDHSFDAISCRFGFMFFPDMKLAAREMARVLKPGGKIATAVWGAPEKNFWVTSIMGTIRKNMDLPPPPPEAPGMFRCAENGMLAQLLREVGLKNVMETEVPGKLNSRTAEVYWDMMTEVGAPIVAALSKAEPSLQDRIKDEVCELIRQNYPENQVSIDASALVVYAEK